MDRVILHPGAIPLSSDGGNIQRNTLISTGWLLHAMIGTAIAIDGLECTPTTPLSMSVQLAPGMISQMQTIDATQFGALSLGSDNIAPLMKMGILPAYDPTKMLFQLAPPNTTGQSINYLIECAFLETDDTPLVLPYFNVNNPLVAFNGPNNSGTPVNTRRTERVQLQLKAGVPATAGTQATPAVDTGWTGIWVVQVNYGDTSINSGRISAYPGAPFLTNKLQNLQVLATGGPYAPIASPFFSGQPRAPVPPIGDSTSLIPTTSWVTSAIQSVPHNLLTFGFNGNGTSTNVFAVPPNVFSINVLLTGGGGGGAGSVGTTGGGGGGAGGTTQALVSVTPGQTFTITIGAGGAPSTGLAIAQNGGSSSFGTLFSSSGGQGGWGQGPEPGGIGGVGQNVVPYAFAIQGGDGTDGYLSTPGAFNPSGTGGASFWGGGGRGGAAGGKPGQAWGSGGGGSYLGAGGSTDPASSATGANGQAGICAIWY